MRRLTFLLAIGQFLLFFLAGTETALASSCYSDAAYRAATKSVVPVFHRDILIMVDETVNYPPAVQSHIDSVIRRLAVPGTHLTIGTFSAYGDSRFTRILSDYHVDPEFPASKAKDVSMRRLGALRACIKARRTSETDGAVGLAVRAMANSNPTIGRSDIMGSVQQVSPRISGSRARQRVLLLVSDMLENSSTTSFYSRGDLRLLDVARELRKAETARLFAALAGARVLVVGGGLQGAASKGRFRTNAEMKRLEEFWRAYFIRSGASAFLFGKPLLLH